MTRDEFIDQLLESSEPAPAASTEIDIDKMVDTISMRIENKMKQEIEKILKSKEEKENDNSNKSIEGINQEGTIQVDKEPAADLNQGS